MKVCKGNMYMNAGLMKLTPSLQVYHMLRATLFSSNYTDCGGEPLTDQDVVRELAFSTKALGTFHTWPLCFNYRGWPNQNHCLRGEGPMVSHQDRALWPSRVRAWGLGGVETTTISSVVRSCSGRGWACSRSSL